MSRSSVLRTLDGIPGIEPATARSLLPVMKVFEFRVSQYYSDLIDWADPQDPLRQIVLPHVGEIDSPLDLDASAEHLNTHAHGLQHKYRPTALLLVNEVCAAYCRFCFRKRFTLSTSQAAHIIAPGAQEKVERETTFDVRAGLDYIADHPEINNVLITGGDPLTLSVSRLEPIIAKVREIPHIKIIRIGSKVPAFDPAQITDALLSMLRNYSTIDKRIYMIVHFNHQRELTPLACSRLEAMAAHGLITTNQTPLLRGVNDSVAELTALHRRLAECGVAPYYVFHCRPSQGNERFMMPMQEGLRIVEGTRAELSGLAKRFRYVGSHATGKIEIVGECARQLMLRYHEAKDPRDENRMMSWPMSEPVFWFDPIVAQGRGDGTTAAPPPREAPMPPPSLDDRELVGAGCSTVA